MRVLNSGYQDRGECEEANLQAETMHYVKRQIHLCNSRFMNSD